MTRARGFAVAAGAALTLVPAAAAQARTIAGTVVHRNARAHSFVVAARSGQMVAVHAARAPRLGARVVVRVHALRNGTFAASTVRVVGHRSHVSVRGVVTHVDSATSSFTVSSRGVSMLVRRGSAHAARAADALPADGEEVTVTGHLDGAGELDAEAVGAGAPHPAGVYVEGTVLAVEPLLRTLTISADDDAQSGQGITVVVPASIELTTFTVGEEVELQATLQADGTYLLEGSASDNGASGASNEHDQQGSQSGEQGQEGASGHDEHPATQG